MVIKNYLRVSKMTCGWDLIVSDLIRRRKKLKKNKQKNRPLCGKDVYKLYPYCAISFDTP